MKKYNLEPKDLQLEITETVYTEEKQVIYSIISELQEAGFKILMDDFGSGYSSLNMLKDAPIDVLNWIWRLCEIWIMKMKETT